MTEFDVWNEFFLDLAEAEYAASREALWISTVFQNAGETKLSEKYGTIAEEERKHGDLMTGLSEGPMQSKARASQEILSGSRCSFEQCQDNALLERLVLVHLVFEPSALAILSFIVRNTKEFFNPGRAKRVKQDLCEILMDESKHIKESLDLIQVLWANAEDDVRKSIDQSVGRHRSFIKAGIRTTFSKQGPMKFLGRELTSRFDFSFQQTTRGVIYGI